MRDIDKSTPPTQPLAKDMGTSSNMRINVSRHIAKPYEDLISQTPQIGSQMPDYVDSNELLAGSGQPQIKPKKKGIFAKLRKK